MDYIPSRRDTSQVELPGSLDRLTGRMTRNVHEVWASGRLAQGWSYGPARRVHPCPVPCDLLPGSEREYDRRRAFGTLKLIPGLGFRIER